MITNERQLQISKAQAARFRESLDAMERGSSEGSGLDAIMGQTQIDAVRGQLESLLAEIREYEELRSGRTSIIELASLAELPDGLIRARIAAGLTQKELAERLGLREQQIQRYEASRYVHFFTMAAIVGFLVIHVVLAIVVPRSLRAMIAGR